MCLQDGAVGLAGVGVGKDVQTQRPLGQSFCFKVECVEGAEIGSLMRM